MAERIGTLGKATDNATGTLLYRVPNGGWTVIGVLVVCNREAATNAYRIAILDDNEDAAGVDVSDYTYYGNTLDANDTFELLRGFTLGSGEGVMVWGEDTNVTFVLSGIENDGA